MTAATLLKRETPLIFVQRHEGMGDVIAATCVTDKLREMGRPCVLRCNPVFHPVLIRSTRLAGVEASAPYSDVVLDGVYEKDPNRATRHFSDMFVEAANRQLSAHHVHIGKPTNCRPKLYVMPAEQEPIRLTLSQYPHPWTFICPRSNSWAARTVPDLTWSEASGMIRGTKFWIGTGPAPPGIVDLNCHQVTMLVPFISVADLVLTVDTGPMHISAALGVPVVAIGQSSSPELHLSDQRDFVTMQVPVPCANCQQNVCPINVGHPPCQNADPHSIAAAA